MKVGVSVRCGECHRTKKPRGRSAPVAMASGLCDHDCDGYNMDPQPGCLWPGETEADFGYPIGPHGWRDDGLDPANGTSTAGETPPEAKP